MFKLYSLEYVIALILINPLNYLLSLFFFLLFSLLEMLPEMFKDTRETDAVLGPVISAGLEALKVSFF